MEFAKKEKVIAVRLKTRDKIRDLRRKLYLKAKREIEFRFYLLHDKIWREDIIQRAYRLVRANGGAPGIDARSEEVMACKGLNEFAAIEVLGAHWCNR